MRTKGLAILAGLSLSVAASSMEINAKSGIIVDAETGKVLWAREADVPRYPASTTKIMTAMLLLERCTPDEVIIAPLGIDKVEGASLHLKPGEAVTVGDMLYAIMLRSANDGCVAAAQHVAGSVPAFVKLMNERAEQLGCTSTNFNNPNGLNDTKHVTSARDLALIARAAMKYQAFRDIVRVRKHTITRSINTQDSTLVSKNKYLSWDSTADGIKTGWTRDAGQCYVGSATRDGYRVITVILKSEDWKKDHKQMLDWAFKNHEKVTIAQAGQPVAELAIENGVQDKVSAVVTEDIRHIYAKDRPAQPRLQPIPVKELKAPIKKGQQIGQLVVSDDDGWEQRLTLFAAADVPEASPMGRNMGIVLLVGGLGSVLYVKKRGRRGSYGRSKRRRGSVPTGRVVRTVAQTDRGVRPMQPPRR